MIPPLTPPIMGENPEKVIDFLYLFSILSAMQIVPLTLPEIILTESATYIDRGDCSTVRIHVSSGVILHYVGLFDTNGSYTREFILEEDAVFGGGVVVYGSDVSYQATTRIVWDSVTSRLQILGLAGDGARLDIRGSSIVDAPYRHTETRVDQNNIFLGEGGSIRGMPVLEIATDDIEWGHSCRIHRISAESLFYLQSHGLDATTAEWLLIEAELRKHTSVIGDCETCDSLVDEIQGVIFA